MIAVGSNGDAMLFCLKQEGMLVRLPNEIHLVSDRKEPDWCDVPVVKVVATV